MLSKEPHSELNNLFRRNWLRNDLETMYTISPISTMSASRMQAVMDAIRYVKAKDIPGDIVECGVFMGGNIALALAEMYNLDLDRKFWAYDTFEGVPRKELIDTDREIEIHSSGAGESVERWYNEEDQWCYCPKDGVIENVANIIPKLIPDLYDANRMIDKKVNFVEGSVLDTIPNILPEKISFIRLDMDIAVPTKHALEHLWDLVSIGGVMHIDDYNMFGGVHEVVDEFFKDKFVYIQEIDYAASAIVRLS